MSNDRPKVQRRHGVRMAGIAAVALAVSTLAACQAGPGAPSPLQVGYVYYDFAVANQAMHTWSSTAAHETVVDTSASNTGQRVYVQVICAGKIVASGSNYVFKTGPLDASTTLPNVAAPMVSGCTFREHVPKAWPLPTISVGAVHNTQGAITSIGAVITND